MIKNTLAEIIFKTFYAKVSQMMTEIDIFKNIPTLPLDLFSYRNEYHSFEG